ncbi:MAG: CDP-glycerol glycerophosphotransferase family protein [Clostridia bacterium]|nr:CDP-glycerol glycerophosphotransferase family protein [Clostridia bacterium]
MLNKLLKVFFSAVYSLFPVKKNRVVFSSYYGRGYSDSPKAIAEEMIKRGTDAELIWLCKNEREAATLPPEIKPCPHDSIKRIHALATARVWVDNSRKYERLRKKKSQKYLQCWHGFPLKRIEKDAVDKMAPDFEKGAIRDSKNIDLLLAYAEADRDILRRCYWYDGEIAVWGVPRNDVFITPNPDTAKKVKDAMGLPEDRRLLLYAPTFRADHSTDAYRIDATRIKAACEARFSGEWTVLVRLHPNVAKQSEGLFPYDGNGIVDATLYPDMQELLTTSDILITDYSSSMFDFGLSGRLCLRAAFDLEDYMADRNFYFDFEEIPFPAAYSNDDLVAVIEQFDAEKYEQARGEFYKKTAFASDGKAAARCADWIEEKLG